MLNRSKNLRMFAHPTLERFSHVHPVLPGLLFLPVVGYFLMRAVMHNVSWVGIVGGTLLGMLSWTLMEYLLHRVVFHFAPRNTWQERIMFMLHGIHHDDPHDAMRLVMVPAVSIPLALFFYPLFTLLMGTELGAIFFAGFVLGYLGYDYSHFYIHHGRPNAWWGKLVRRHHYLHHHAHEASNFGVSTPLWDVVFGTYVAHSQPQQAVQKYRAS